MKRLILLAALGALAGCSTSYRAPILGLGGGYTDHKINRDTWEVTFGTNAYTARGYALNAALYRSAELAQRGGFPYFQILRSSLVVGYFSVGYGYAPAGGTHYGGEGVTFTIHGVQSRDAPLACENSKPEGCMTLATDDVLRQLEPVVRRKPQK